MAYHVFILEPLDRNNWVELDAEDLDMGLTYSVAPIEDISQRADTISKQITFKGSKINDNAFGSCFHLNRTTNLDLPNKIGFNYNALRPVDCLIYEDGILLMRGTMRISEIDVDHSHETLYYQTIVTGSLIELKNAISEKKLDDLSFASLEHDYTWQTISDSWATRIKRTLTATIGGNVTRVYYWEPFQLGRGYVYPFIDYGARYASTTGSTSDISVLNFRPAIYVREYINAIFAQPELSGYTFEVKGSDDLVKRFNSLIIPNNDEVMRTAVTGQTLAAQTYQDVFAPVDQVIIYGQDSTVQQHKDDIDPRTVVHAIPLPYFTGGSPTTIFERYGTINNTTDATFIFDKTVKTSGQCRVSFMSFQNNTSCDVRIHLQFCAREFIADTDPAFQDGLIDGGWEVIADQNSLVCPAHSALPRNPGFPNLFPFIAFDIPERTYNQNSLFYLRVMYEVPRSCDAWLNNNDISYSIYHGFVSFGSPTGIMTFDNSYGDRIIPKPVEGIKQIDFLKSVINLFNFYVYSEKETPKHLIFQSYDDYYVFTEPQYLQSTAFDWSRKIDYTSPFKILSNLGLPKKYLFTLKQDGDYINKTYQDANGGIVYGEFRFTDELGLTEEKKLELVFSPSPLVEYSGTFRVHPSIIQQDGNTIKPIKSNIRILYYNGLKKCSTYQVGIDGRNLVPQSPFVQNFYYLQTGILFFPGVDNPIPNPDFVGYLPIASGVTYYPNCGNYFLPDPASMIPTNDLYFGLPRQFYFNASPEYYTCPTAYFNYFEGKITSITNPDVSFLEAEVYLNEVDIGNLNLRIPVFLNLNAYGNGYFKVLSVEYHHNLGTSSVRLQKIP